MLLNISPDSLYRVGFSFDNWCNLDSNKKDRGKCLREENQRMDKLCIAFLNINILICKNQNKL